MNIWFKDWLCLNSEVYDENNTQYIFLFLAPFFLVYPSPWDSSIINEFQTNQYVFHENLNHNYYALFLEAFWSKTIL